MTGLRVLVLGSEREAEATWFALQQLWGVSPPGWTVSRCDHERCDTTTGDIALVFLSRWLTALETEAAGPVLARIHDTVLALRQRAGEIFVCTIVKSDAVHREGTDMRGVAAIRRLNHSAVMLSHAIGCGVIDIDRRLAAGGSANYATDHLLSGSHGLEAAAWAVGMALHESGACHRLGRDNGQQVQAALAAWRPRFAPQAAGVGPVVRRASTKRRLVRQGLAGFLTWRAVLHAVRTGQWRQIVVRLRR